jgi:hypothetical protein
MSGFGMVHGGPIIGFGLEDQDIEGTIILNWTLKKQEGGVRVVRMESTVRAGRSGVRIPTFTRDSSAKHGAPNSMGTVVLLLG